MKCPQCQTEAAQVGTIWICPNHGQLPEVRLFAPLRIFLSYGHDANEELVRRIKADLEKRGHDVWFDKNEIKFGDDWRREITDGILQSHRVLSFLSKHSTCDPGVCRDEIAIAIGVKGGNIQTILVESEAEVQPPVNISHVQWLDMYDWKERRAAGEAAWEQWYQAKLAEIIRVVESDESRRFAGEIETLNGHLKPIKSEARLYDLLKKGFFGRAWLFEAVEQWRTGRARHSVHADSQSEDFPPGLRRAEDCAPYHGGPSGTPCGTHRLFWITGDPGVGKRRLCRPITHTRSDAVIAAQFVEWDKPDHRDARRVVRSLAFQLATRLPDYRKLLLTLPEIAKLDEPDPETRRMKNEAELFDYLLANPLVEMLARHATRLPDWLGLVVTSRPESAVKTPLQGLNPFVLDTRTEANRADLRDYLRRQLAPQLQDRPDAGRLVEQILEKSKGVFLYVERFCGAIQRGHLCEKLNVWFAQALPLINFWEAPQQKGTESMTTRTKTFIGSSTEGLAVAKAIEAHLSDVTDVMVWTDGMFLPGRTFVETLEKLLEEVDYAVLVASLDDLLVKREVENFSMGGSSMQDQFKRRIDSLVARYDAWWNKHRAEVARNLGNFQSELSKQL